MKQSHTGRERNDADPNTQEVYQKANEEGGKDVGKRKDGIEQLKLSLADVQVILHGLLEGLRVVEGVLIAEDHH